MTDNARYSGFAWQRRVRQVLLKAVFALPVAAVLLAGAHQASESQGAELSSEEGSGNATKTAEPDSLMLVNRTDTAFAVLAFPPNAARPLKAKIEVNQDEKRTVETPSFYVAAGDSTALWRCDSLDAYEDYTLHLYRVPGDGGIVQAPLTRSVRLTAERLMAARQRRCRLEIGDL